MNGDRPAKNEIARLPKMAERLLLLFVSERNRDCICGDLAEAFERIVLPDFGCARARIWYWKQVFFCAGFQCMRNLRSLLSLNIFGGFGLDVARFYLAAILVYAIMAVLYICTATLSGVDISRFHTNPNWHFWRIFGSIGISLFSYGALRRSKNWTCMLWAYVMIFSSGYGILFTLLLSDARIGHYSWSREICLRLTLLSQSVLGVEIFLGILAIGFTVLVDYWILRHMLCGDDAPLVSRFRVAGRYLFLPVFIAVVVWVISISVVGGPRLGYYNVGFTLFLRSTVRLAAPMLLPVLIAVFIAGFRSRDDHCAANLSYLDSKSRRIREPWRYPMSKATLPIA